MLKIASKILWENRSGKNVSWFQPRACSCGGGEMLMTLQSISGSDYYGPLHQSFSHDAGNTWSRPEPIPGFEWKTAAEGISEGICDVVPEYHAPSGTVLAIGHNVYYRDGKLFDSLGDWRKPELFLQRYCVWSVFRNGVWSAPRRLAIPGMEKTTIYSCGCSQRIFTGDDLLLIPLTLGLPAIRPRKVTSVLCRFDGREIIFEKTGRMLELPVGRGLLEPSMTRWDGGFLMTLRAEDGCGYHVRSSDGLDWGKPLPWRFDNGERLEMSSTQQHFLHLAGKLYLVYTRNNGENSHFFRWRTPLFLAEVDRDLELIRDTEQVVFPMLSEGENAAGMGNFQVSPAGPDSALITVGEERGHDHYYGNTLAAFITAQ